MRGIELTPDVPVSTLTNHTERAAESGFDTVFLSHHYNNRDEFAALAAIAREVDTVRLGPGIANPYETHPVTLASRMATLDELSGGRGVFGLGPGDRSTLANLGFSQDDALRRVLETMQVSRKLWAGERVDHEGTFTANDAGLNYEAREIPVYVGAQGPHMTRMAAKYADGLLFNGSHPLDIEWAAERVEEGLEERADDVEFDFAAYASVSVASDRERAREAARPPVAFITAGAPPPVLDRHGVDESRADEIRLALSGGEFSRGFEQVTERMLDAFCVAGRPETVTGRLDDLLDIADSVVVGAPLGPDVEEALTLLDGSALSDRT